MKSTFTELLPIGVFLTFISSLFALFFNYSAVRKSKYIEFVTSEKIKWVESIKTESSILISKIHLSLIVFNRRNMELRSQNGQQNDISVETELQRSHVHSQTTDFFQEDSKQWNHSEIIKKLQLLSFRFNIKQNTSLLKTIEYFMNFYLERFHSDDEIREAENKLNSFKLQLHESLENEWRKIKREI